MAISKRQRRRVEIWRRVRNPAFAPFKNWMAKLRFDYDFKGKRWTFLQIQMLPMLGVKVANMKTNKITIAKNRKLATQNFLFSMHTHFPFGNLKRRSF